VCTAGLAAYQDVQGVRKEVTVQVGTPAAAAATGVNAHAFDTSSSYMQLDHVEVLQGLW
jgi:hypothetical protein